MKQIKINDIKSLAHTRWNCKYHIVFAPKYRMQVIYGKIMGIHSLISFESESATDIETEFHNAVDDYLSYCEEEGIEPEKTILMED